MRANGTTIFGRYVQQHDQLTAIINCRANFRPTQEQIRDSMAGPQEAWLTHQTLLPKMRLDEQYEVDLVVHRDGGTYRVNYDAEGRAYYCVDSEGKPLELVDIVAINQ